MLEGFYRCVAQRFPLGKPLAARNPVKLASEKFLRCDIDRHTFSYKSEPQVFAAQGWPHAALVLVDHEFQTLREEPLDRRKHAVSTPLGSCDGIGVVVDRRSGQRGIECVPQSAGVPSLFEATDHGRSGDDAASVGRVS